MMDRRRQVIGLCLFLAPWRELCLTQGRKAAKGSAFELSLTSTTETEKQRDLLISQEASDYGITDF